MCVCVVCMCGMYVCVCGVCVENEGVKRYLGREMKKGTDVLGKT